MIVVTHGWHVSVRVPDRGAEPVFPGCLVVQIDMRGRKYSTGTSDGNGRELLDVYDGINFVKREYAPFWSGGVHFYRSSGGGGNGLGMVVKFPWLLDSCTVTAPISDYALWFAEDAGGWSVSFGIGPGMSSTANPKGSAVRIIGAAKHRPNGPCATRWLGAGSRPGHLRICPRLES